MKLRKHLYQIYEWNVTKFGIEFPLICFDFQHAEDKIDNQKFWGRDAASQMLKKAASLVLSEATSLKKIDLPYLKVGRITDWEWGNLKKIYWGTLIYGKLR